MPFNTPKFNVPTPPLLVTNTFKNFLSLKKLDSQFEKIGKNVGFIDKNFQALMDKVGFYDGAAWCAFYVKLIYMQLYSFDKEWLSKNIDGSAMGNLNRIIRLNKSGDKKYIAIINNDQPQVGDVFCMGEVGKGHTGIVVEVLGKSGNGWKVKTIEGNTGATGSREGDKTAYLTRIFAIGEKVAGSDKKFNGYWRRNFTEQELSQIVYDEVEGTYVMKRPPSIAGKQLKKTPSVGGFDPYSFLKL
jgi:hypothetical protein